MFMAKYLVTGAAGFIGSNLMHALVARGEQVRGVDNFSHGRRENLAGITGKIEFMEADTTDSDMMLSACQGVDYVLHQAALGSVPRSIANPLASNHANVVGTLNVLEAARRSGVKRVVYASSSSIYGDTPTLPKHEEMAANPISPYSVSKYTGELYAQSFSRVLGLETVSLRYFNVFGPRQHPTSEYAAVVPKFIRAMIHNEQPTIFGDGRQSRDFTYIENVVSANLLACAAPAERVNGKAFNVAAGEKFSLLEMYELLKDLTGFSQPPLFAGSRAGDVRDSLANISRAESAMGYKVLVNFTEGLRRTAEWYRAEFGASSTPATERNAIAH